jgi:hypothetical protein
MRHLFSHLTSPGPFFQPHKPRRRRGGRLLFPLLLLPLLACGLFGCAEEIEGCTDPSSPDYNPAATVDDGSCSFAVPTSYVFERNEQSAVGLETQVVHSLLISDLTILIDSLGQDAGQVLDSATLNDRIGLPDASLPIPYPLGTVNMPLQSSYGDFATASALSSNWVEVSGYFEPGAQLEAWFDSLARRNQEGLAGMAAAYTTAQGLDLSRLIPLSLYGAVHYAQAVDSLLPFVDTLDNINFLQGSNYTAMEQAWDQAFGYFGAARNYASFSDANLAGTGFSHLEDADRDGLIDFTTEVNFHFARLAGARDQGSGGATNFTETIFEAFLLGRAAMAIGPGEEELIRLNRDLIVENWEQVVAASTVHHLNRCLEQLDKMGQPTFDREAYRADWAAMFAYARMLGYRADGPLGGTFLVQVNILDLMGDAPFEGEPGQPDWLTYQANLLGTRAYLGQAFGFSEALLEQW